MEPIAGPRDPVVDTASLAREMAGREPPVLLDVRWQLGGPPGIGAYREGHLPGAVFVDLDRDLSGEPGAGGRHPLPGTAAFQAAMRRAGVSGDRPVVLYDEADATSAARGWWLLRYFGHGDVRVLDGGYRAWASAGKRVTAGEPPAPAPGDFTARPGHMPLLGPGGAAGLARRGVLFDARAPERYRGETEPIDSVAGHIPGAVSAPTTENLSADGRFLPAAGLRARFAGLGAGEAGQEIRDPAAATGAGTQPVRGAAADGKATGPLVGTYCGSGVTAAHEVLALAIAGIPAALYVGSWSQWIADPVRPIATGPDPG